MAMIQLWIEVKHPADKPRLRQHLRDGGFQFIDPSIATSETMEELEARLDREQRKRIDEDWARMKKAT